MDLLNLFSFLGRRRETINHPPFSIKKRRVVERRFRYNEGTISKTVYTQYEVFYKGQLISFSEALDGGTGVPGIWKAYCLKNAPTPTIIVASKNAFIITEENGAAKVSLIEKKTSNYASLQWLDGQEGQPGIMTKMLIGEDNTDCSLDGGKLLLINGDTVLRVSDLSVFYFKKNTDLTDGYYTGAVVAFSPDKNEIVFKGSKSHEINRTEYIYAMVVYNYKDNQAYAIPFDKTETRLHQPHHIDHRWVHAYFEWQENEKGKYLLNKKKLDQLPNWEGYFTKTSSYSLDPVSEHMYPVFFNFAKTFLQLNEANISTNEYEGRKEYQINHRGFVFNIGYSPEFKTVSFSLSFMNKAPEEEANLIIKKVGTSFNKTLKKGMYQEFFTHF